jgi:hypothetical protein
MVFTAPENQSQACALRRVGSKEPGILPAKSAAQQKAAGAALSAKRGETPKTKLQGASKSMEKSMTEDQLEELASTKREGKPEHASKS